MKKLFPLLVLVLMALLTIVIRRCNNQSGDEGTANTSTRSVPRRTTPPKANADGFDRSRELFFSKHARCRMSCRKISQEEVREIQARGRINYSKSKLEDPRGPSYAVEGYTSDGQKVRIIFAPKQKHTTVVTVIDLENEYQCPSC